MISCVWLYWERWTLKDWLCRVVLPKMDLRGLVVYGYIGFQTTQTELEKIILKVQFSIALLER